MPVLRERKELADGPWTRRGLLRVTSSVPKGTVVINQYLLPLILLVALAATSLMRLIPAKAAEHPRPEQLLGTTAPEQPVMPCRLSARIVNTSFLTTSESKVLYLRVVANQNRNAVNTGSAFFVRIPEQLLAENRVDRTEDVLQLEGKTITGSGYLRMARRSDRNTKDRQVFFDLLHFLFIVSDDNVSNLEEISYFDASTVTIAKR